MEKVQKPSNSESFISVKVDIDVDILYAGWCVNVVDDCEVCFMVRE
jgi:hypothetical protein